MTARQPENAVSVALSTASSSLSQLVARILEQLALSAWLPAGALTLLVTFIMRVGGVLEGHGTLENEGKPAPLDPGVVISSALEQMANISIGGAVLLVLTVVVVTMVTQAFTFESIRLLEGYWGVWRPFERVAQARAKHWRNVRKRLVKRQRRLTKQAWKRAKLHIAADDDYTNDMVQALGAQVLGRDSPSTLNDAQVALVDSTDWWRYAPSDLRRRHVNVEKALDDFPHSKHMMPTRLGNVLRRFENDTGYETVQDLVDRSFHLLPPSLQSSHDEQRGRLDLYCSMFLVAVTSGLIAALRFNSTHVTYTVVALVVASVGAWSLYRAAVASARYYGSLLVAIAEYVREEDSRSSDHEVSVQAGGSWLARLRRKIPNGQRP
ncbi:hypothetical protein [Arthrobacter sp. 260]|uniref:hypothetical protein n=1 Tax=Arthrobacter sp. 260 TaxID=2735314 RepID=UPI001490F43E|nr:hypothetical protein [Arthrobacter sp. 260]NOJ61027.1 hypothetical protein [Arthrobacter sp. 260]